MWKIQLCSIAGALIVGLFPLHGAEDGKPNLLQSQLGSEPNKEILRLDLDRDGDPDIIECWHEGKRVRFFDENDDATGVDVWGDMVNDAMQVDNDNNGYYDGSKDFTLKWADNDRDGIPDMMLYNLNRDISIKNKMGGDSGISYIAFDPENTGCLVDINWSKLKVSFTRIERGPNWLNNYHGNSSFIKQHAPFSQITPLGHSWENPFHFYDPDGDGAAEISLRVTDSGEVIDPITRVQKHNGLADEIWVSYDLDNDSAKGNEKDYDLTIYVGGGQGYDYTKDIHHYPTIKAPDWALPYYDQPEWRTMTQMAYIPREGAIAKLMACTWAKAYLSFDEDDDCHRWERVELLYPGNPYQLDRKAKNSCIRHTQSDSLGDRGEWDADFSGKGQVYRSSWDGKLHLLGAEMGAWTVDQEGKYWGAVHDNKVSSLLKAEKVEEVILYEDRNKNGFFDTVSYDYDGDGVPDRIDNLLELGLDDVQAMVPLASMGYSKIVEESSTSARLNWRYAQQFYQLAFKYGFTNINVYKFGIASTTAEMTSNAFWLKEAILRTILHVSAEETNNDLLKAYYSNDIPKLGRILHEISSKK